MDKTIVLGAFEVGSCIGQGGMGRVFQAVHRGTDTPVALKVIAGEPDDASRSAFHREVQAHAELVHPGIVYLFDYGTVDRDAAEASDGTFAAGESYVAMELAGGTVHEELPLTDWKSARRVLLQVLDGLAFAHARRVIHRDLKPENLLLFDGANGPRVKLADFGLAHALGRVLELDERSLARFSGTPYYMAPEQLRSQWRRYGPWTDLYALGCVAWHLVCGRPPYTGDSLVAVAMQHCDDRIPRLRPSFAVPAGLEAWIHRAMATDPGARFQSAADATWALMHISGQGSLLEPRALTQETLGPTAPTALMKTLPWQEMETLVVHEPVDMTSQEVAPLSPGAAAPTPAPLPRSWRVPDPEPQPAGLLGAGLGLFGLREVPLVDRDRERDRIWRALTDVVQERSLRVVFICGQTGVGGTRLADWMATRAHEVGAARVYRTTFALGTRQSAAGFAGLVQDAFHTWRLGRPELFAELSDRLQQLGEDDDTLLNDAKALTELIQPSPDHGEVHGPRFWFSGSEQKHTLVARVLARLGWLRPPILCLDDLHHDPDAVGLLEHLVDSRDPPPALILTTLHSDLLAEDPELERRISRLVDGGSCERIELGPIGPDDHRKLIGQMLPLAPDLLDLLARRTEGNPLFARQLLSDLIARRCIKESPRGFDLVQGIDPALPNDIHQIWIERIQRLVDLYPPAQAETAREAIELAAAFGREVSFDEWQRACADEGLSLPTNLIEELGKRGLAHRSADGLSFAHGLLVDSIQRESIQRERWASHHRRCALTLERLYPGQSGATAKRRATHWLAAGEDERALTPLLDAVRHHRTAGDLNLALSLSDLHDQARQRLSIGEDDRRTVSAWLQRAQLGRFLGDIDNVELLLQRCAALCKMHRWDDLFAGVSVTRALVAESRGDVESGLTFGEEALSLYQATGEKRGITRTLRILGRLHRYSGDGKRAHEHFGAAVQMAGELGDPHHYASALRSLSLTHTDRREYEAAIELLSRALAMSKEIGDTDLASACLNSLGENFRFSGDLQRAEEYYRQGLATDTQAGVTQYIQIWHINLGILLSMQGEFSQSVDSFRKAQRIATQQNLSGYVGYVHACILFPIAALGDWALFDRHLTLAREHIAKWPIYDRSIAECCAQAGRIAADAGEAQRARAAFGLAREQWVHLDEPEEVARIDAF